MVVGMAESVKQVHGLLHVNGMITAEEEESR